jgi:hypothetical protein
MHENVFLGVKFHLIVQRLRVREMLVEGRIAPGAKLNERELCALLSISRPPLREAIERAILSQRAGFWCSTCCASAMWSWI